MLGRREIHRLIVARPNGTSYEIVHRIAGEAIVCVVPTLEMAGWIVRALRERQYVKQAEAVLARHMKRKAAAKRVPRGARR